MAIRTLCALRRTLLLTVIALSLLGCNFAKKQIENRDEGALRLSRAVNVYAVDKDGRMIIVEVTSSGGLTRDEGGTGDHKELTVDPSKLKQK